MNTVIYLECGLTPHLCRVEQASGSIRELAPSWDVPFVAFVDGQPVLRADWELVLEDGQAIAFIEAAAIPQGGGGGSNPLRMVLMIAVMIYAPQLAASMMYGDGIMAAAALGSTGLAVMSAASIMVGVSLVNAILPPPKLPSTQQAASLAAASPTYSLQAQGNSARIDGAIPEHFGRMICFPDFAAQPYAEFAGNEQYLYSLLCIGRGSYEVETLKIEDTPIDNYDEVVYEFVPPGGAITLFPTNVTTSSEVSGQTPDANWTGPFIASGVDEFSNFLAIDLLASKGLYYANDDGSLASMTATVEVQAQEVNEFGVGVGSWISLSSNASISGATTTPQRESFRFQVNAARYQVRLRRVDTAHTETRYGHDLAWIGLRAYMPDSRVYGDMTMIAVKMRASNNLSSLASRKINLVCTRKLPIWNGSSWSSPTATRSPSWALAYAAKQIGLSDAQIDLAGLLTLDAICTSRGDSFDARFDNFLSFWEAAGKMLGAVRAKPFMQGGVLRATRDQAVSIPVAMFSQRNIVKGSFSINYLMPTADTADAVDVKYFDSTKWAPFTVRAKLSSSTASVPAKIELFGVIGRDQAYREGMYYAAANRYRRRIIKFQTEMEGFIPSFGDLINIQHDMPAWGQSGEVTDWDSASKTLTLSESPTWGTGTHYIGLRKRDGSVNGPYLVTAGTNANQVILAVSPPTTPYIGLTEERTHYSFGWAETWRQPARVLSVRPMSLTTVEIEAVNEDSNVHTADTGLLTPIIVTSALANYTNAPVVTGVTVTPMIYMPNMLVVAWQPAAWADSYIVEQSADGVIWTEAGATVLNTLTVTALHGHSTLIRVAAVGLSRGPWSGDVALSVDKTPSPLAPTATVTGGLFCVILAWSFGDTIGGRTGTEIWWSGTNNRAAAARLSVEPFPGQSYVHIGLAAGQCGYYWVRVGDIYGNFSPFYPSGATNGLHGVATIDPSLLLTQLNSAIGTTQLTTNLAAKITLIDTVNSAVTQAASDIVAEAATRAAAVLTEATARGAAITAESTIRQSAESSIASSVTTLSAATATNIAAAVQTETTARTSADSAIASSVTTLASTTATNIAAAVQTETTARTSADSAIATSVTTLASTTATNIAAAVQTETTARTGADTALASSITTVASSVTTANAAIAAEAVTRAGVDTAQAATIATVVASVATANAAIVSEASTRVSGDSAQAALTGQVQARLDTGDFATVKTTANATASRTGVLEARHTVHLDVNGYVSGTESVNDGTSSSFVVLADKFLVAKPDGSGTPIPMLTLGTIDGQTTLGVAGNLIVDGVVSTKKIAGQAVTVPAFTRLNSDVIVNGETKTLLSFSMDTDNKPIVVFFALSGGIYDKNWGSLVEPSLWVNGVKKAYYSDYGTDSYINFNGLCFIDSPGSGSFSVELRFLNEQSDDYTIISQAPWEFSPATYMYALGTKR